MATTCHNWYQLSSPQDVLNLSYLRKTWFQIALCLLRIIIYKKKKIRQGQDYFHCTVQTYKCTWLGCHVQEVWHRTAYQGTNCILPSYRIRTFCRVLQVQQPHGHQPGKINNNKFLLIFFSQKLPTLFVADKQRFYNIQIPLYLSSLISNVMISI